MDALHNVVRSATDKVAFEYRAYDLARSLMAVSRRIAQRVAPEGSKAYKGVVRIIDKEVHRMMDVYCRPLDL